MDLEEPGVAFSFEKAVWTLWTFHFAFFAVRCLTRSTTLVYVDRCSLFVCHQLNGVFGHEFGFLCRKPFIFGNNWCIIEGSVEVLNEVQSTLVY